MSKKIIDLVEYQKIYDNKLKSKKIVHCHGVFDLLHIGHIRHLKNAKKHGEILVVTITADKYVNKGFGRPYFNQNLRAEALSALDCVNYVIINNSSVANQIIKKIRAKYYVKGIDYKAKTKKNLNLNMEEKSINSIGGKLVLTDTIKYSSSNLINTFSNIYNSEQKKFIYKLKKVLNFDEISNYFKQILKLKVLIIGETIIDEYLYCDIVGKSGKDPMLVSKFDKSQKYAGGIISIANNISDFCKNIELLTYIGSEGEKTSLNYIKNNINKNIKLNYVIKKNSPTITKTRILDNYTKLKINGIYNVNNNQLQKEEEEKFIKLYNNKIKNADVVIVADYSHGLMTNKIVKNILRKKKYLAVNAQLNSMNSGHFDISRYKGFDYLCIHEGELRNYLRNEGDQLEKLIIKLYRQLSLKKIIITLGNKGTVAYDGYKMNYCPAFATNVKDRTGAGDALLGFSTLLNYLDINANAVQYCSNLAAAQTVEQFGTSIKIQYNTIIDNLKYSLL